MSSCRSRRWLATLAVAVAVAGVATAVLAAPAKTSDYPGIGRPATPREVAAWDTDVRPDFKGLPRGSGSVAQGQDLWEAKCASCHGIFGEANTTFTPLVGGTTKEDIARGRVARLDDASFPGRTTMMKLPTVSTLWDYIRRAMPWNEPKSLTDDEVYAVTAFLLHLADVVPADFTLSDRNISDVQQRLPNRHGMTTDHHLWPGKGVGNGGRADIRATACMRDCAPEPGVASMLPDFARNAHGNLAEQNRDVGAQRGADTTQPAAARPTAKRPTEPRGTPAVGAPTPTALARQHGCLVCHGVDAKNVGPAFVDVGRKYADRADAAAHLQQRIRAGSVGVWGPVAMPAQTLPDADAATIAQWLVRGAKP